VKGDPASLALIGELKECRMNDQFGYFIGCVIAIGGMMFALVMGYLIGS